MIRFAYKHRLALDKAAKIMYSKENAVKTDCTKGAFMGRGIYDEEDERYEHDRYELRDLLIGFILLFFGGFLLLKNITVYSFGFSRWFGSATGGILIVVFIACFMVMVIRTNFFTKMLCILSVISIIINVILGTHLVFNRMSMVELLFMIMMFFGGLAFILKVLFVPRPRSKRRKPRSKEDGIDEVKGVDDELAEMKKNMGK